MSSFFEFHPLISGRKPSDGKSPADELRVAVVGEPGVTEAQALAAFRAWAPATLDGLKLTQCKVTDTVVDGPGGAVFFAEASYATGDDPQDKEAGESSFSFDTSGGTFHVTQSKQTTGSGAVTGSAPDLNGVIGATADGADGTDVTIPQYAFSETHYVADAAVTNTFRGVLFSLTGTTNQAAFKGCATGECLFLGARGSKRGKGDWEITFLFAASPNVSGLTIGDIPGIDKLGWEYLWVLYQKKTVGTGANKILVQVPQFVYTERVYDEGDFALLGIGTT